MFSRKPLNMVLINFVYIVVILCSHSARTDDQHVRKTLETILIGYDKFIRPNYTGAATIVKVGMTILGFGEINERTMTFDIDLFLNQTWYDYRLSHSLSTTITPVMGMKIPTDLIWTPDTHFINAKNAKKHRVTVSNDKLDIHSDGKIYWGSRVTVSATCHMDFKHYPLDTQVCSIALESYSYDTNDLLYQWSSAALEVLSSQVAQFEMTKTYNSSFVKTFFVGDYSILKGMFVFERRFANSILQIFFPCTAIVCVSWISFWLHKNCTSARVGIGVTTMLTICTIWASINRRLPKVNYVKASDIYFISSFSFILCALIEFTMVINISVDDVTKNRQELKMKERDRRREQKNKLKLQRRDSTRRRSTVSKSNSFLFNTSFTNNSFSGIEESFYGQGSILRKISRMTFFKYGDDSENLNSGQHQQNSQLDSDVEDSDDEKPTWYKQYPVSPEPSRIDLVSRVLFPLSFFCFNLYFWIHFRMDPSFYEHIKLEDLNF